MTVVNLLYLWLGAMLGAGTLLVLQALARRSQRRGRQFERELGRDLLVTGWALEDRPLPPAKDTEG